MIENGGSVVDQRPTGEEINFKQELYKILEDKRISPEEAKGIANKFDLEKNDTIQYTYRQIALLKEAMGNAFVGTETWVDKDALKVYLQTLASEAERNPCDPVVPSTEVQPVTTDKTPATVEPTPQTQLPIEPQPTVQIEKTQEETDTQKIRALQEYFHFKDSEIQHIIEALNSYTSTTGLEKDRLSVIPFLEEYKNYLENNLQGLAPEMKENIKQAIGRKTLHISDIIQDRTHFVDQQIEEKNYIESARTRELGNERWNIDHALSQSFDFINHQVLPSASLLVKYQDGKGGFQIPQDQTNTEMQMKLSATQAMLQAPVDKNGDFDRTLSDTLPNGKVWQSYTEHWDIFDDREDGKHWVGKEGIDQTKLLQNTPKINIPSLLNEKDKEIDSKAMKFFMAAIALQIVVEVGPAAAASIIPGGLPIGIALGGITGGGIDLMDMLGDTETLMDALQQAGLVSEEYRMSKTMWDNILSGIGLIPGMTAMLKGPKLARLGAKYGDYREEFVALSGLATSKRGELLSIPARSEYVVNGEKYIVDSSGESVKVYWKIGNTMTPVREPERLSDEIRQALGLDILDKSTKPTKTIDPMLKASRNTYAREMQELMDMMSPEAKHFLSEAGLHLSNKITINGFEYYASNKFTSNGITYVISFIEQGEKVEPRIFRLGNHNTVWQAVPGFHGKDNFPSIAEFSGIDQFTGANIDGNLATFFNQIPEGMPVPNIGKMFGKYFGFYSDVEHRFDVTPLQSAFQRENTPVITGKAGWRQGINLLNKDSKISDVLKRMRNIDMSNFDLSHFQRISTQAERRSDFHLGNVDLQRYETLYEGKKIEVTFGNSINEPDLIWVESIRYIGDKINTYGLPSHPINGGLLTTAPLQKMSRVPTGIQESGAPIIQDGGVNYIDVRRFLQGNPLITKLKELYN